MLLSIYWNRHFCYTILSSWIMSSIGIFMYNCMDITFLHWCNKTRLLDSVEVTERSADRSGHKDPFTEQYPTRNQHNGQTFTLLSCGISMYSMSANRPHREYLYFHDTKIKLHSRILFCIGSRKGFWIFIRLAVESHPKNRIKGIALLFGICWLLLLFIGHLMQ